jgi:hypothetical protein
MFTVPPKNPEGRPPAVIDLLTVERAASIGCTVEDIAALLGLSRKTIYNHMEQDPELAEAMDRGRGMGRASLRRMQWEKAEAGSDTMLIWLGKVFCGQKDTSVVALTGPAGTGPVQSVSLVTNDPIEAAKVYQKFMSED